MLAIRIRSEREVPFTALLVGLILALLAPPMLVRDLLVILILKGAVCLGLLAALFPIVRGSGLFLPLAILAGLGVVSHGVLLVAERPAWAAVSLASDLLMLGTAVVLIGTIVWREQDVTFETILGGTVVYLLVGVTFGVLYSMIETLAPGSFASALQLSPSSSSPGRYPALMYFSFVTLTTLGYGDIVPVSRVPSTLAVAEAITGQLYLVILLARVVGVYAMRR